MERFFIACFSFPLFLPFGIVANPDPRSVGCALAPST
jgi:hypothetical protein